MDKNNIHNPEEVNEILSEDIALADDDLFDLAELFKVFGDYTRVQIMYLLMNEEMSVGDIAIKLGMNSSAISHQLRVLKQTKLIKNRRAGKNIFYSLADDHVETIIKTGLDHVLE